MCVRLGQVAVRGSQLAVRAEPTIFEVLLKGWGHIPEPEPLSRLPRARVEAALEEMVFKNILSLGLPQVNCKGDIFFLPQPDTRCGEGKEDLPGRCMTFLGVHGKPPQTWRYKTTEIYQLTILKVRGHRPRPPRALERIRPCFFQQIS